MKKLMKATFKGLYLLIKSIIILLGMITGIGIIAEGGKHLRGKESAFDMIANCKKSEEEEK